MSSDSLWSALEAEGAQLRDVVAQSADEAVEYDGEQQYGSYGEPDVVLVGL